MLLEILKSKIHRAVVTEADLNYVGSITIDEDLMDAVQLKSYEKVHVTNINNGSRSETYVIKGERGSGCIVMNGALARMAEVGDRVIIMAYGFVQKEEAERYEPKIIIMDENNHISSEH